MKHQFYNKLLILGIAFGGVAGLDVSLEQVVCDKSLPVTADLYMQCNNTGSRCTFGETAQMYGTLHYNSVENSGIQNDEAYMSASLSLWTLSFTLFDKVPMSLCSSAISASENQQNACPGTGAYDFSVDYVLPSAGSPKTSWLASGWSGSGIIQMFAEADDSMKIGECKLELKTYVTPDKAFSNSLVQFPSAAVSSGLLLALLAILALIAFYCACCAASRKAKNKPAEEVTYYKQMEDGKSTKSRGSTSKRSTKTVPEDDSIATDFN